MTIRACQHGPKHNLLAVHRGPCPDRNRAASTEFCQIRPLCINCTTTHGIIDQLQCVASRRIVTSALNPKGTLADLGNHDLWIQYFRHFMLKAKPLKRSECHDNCVNAAFFALGYSGGDISSQLDHVEIRSKIGKHRTPSRCSARDGGTWPKASERSANEGVTHFSTCSNCCQREAWRCTRRQVFGRMHGKISSTIKDELLYFFHKDALAAEGRDRDVKASIAHGCRGEDFNVQ